MTKLWARRPGFDSRHGEKCTFCLRQRVQTSSGAHPVYIQWVPGAPSPEVKLTIHLHLVPKLRIPEAIIPLTQYAFMVWCLIKQRIRLQIVTVKHRGKFTFTFNIEVSLFIKLVFLNCYISLFPLRCIFTCNLMYCRDIPPLHQYAFTVWCSVKAQ
jgi:hypothetical protein